MKKVIIAFDGIHYSDGAFEFARQLNKLQPLFLTAVFVPQTEATTSYADAASRGFIPLLEGTWSEVVERNIEDFEQQCKEHNIAYSMHRDFDDFPVTELKRESVYADLLLVGTEMFYAGSEPEGIPNTYLKKLLHDSKCPVILVPEKFRFPERVVIGYDGSADAVFALKQFVYLLPEFNHFKTLIVLFDDNKDTTFKNEKELDELAARHFTDYTIEEMDVNARKTFNKWLAEFRSALFVCGSYGRSSFSRLIRKSFADPVIREYVLPIFISHK